MKLVWSEPAVANLEAIHQYIRREAPGTADRFVNRLIEVAESLVEQPRRGRVVPEGDGRQREVFVEPYRIIYRVDASAVHVITVVHGARELSAILEGLVN